MDIIIFAREELIKLVSIPSEEFPENPDNALEYIKQVMTSKENEDEV